MFVLNQIAYLWYTGSGCSLRRLGLIEMVLNPIVVFTQLTHYWEQLNPHPRSSCSKLLSEMRRWSHCRHSPNSNSWHVLHSYVIILGVAPTSWGDNELKLTSALTSLWLNENVLYVQTVWKLYWLLHSTYLSTYRYIALLYIVTGRCHSTDSWLPMSYPR
jgi:hypothetical protein